MRNTISRRKFLGVLGSSVTILPAIRPSLDKTESKPRILTDNNFFFGTSTAAHQIEGGLQNNWSQWSQKKPDLEPAGQAVDHYNRYEDDYQIANELNHNALRLSIPWSRIMPSENTIDKNALEHYRKRVKVLKQNNIEPIVTLWHFSHPKWFMRQGGWVSGPIHKFSEFVSTVVNYLQDDVKLWITLNEPQGFAAVAYGIGKWPNSEHGVRSYLKAEKNMIEAHKTAKSIIDNISQNAYVGSAITKLSFKSDGTIFGDLGTKIADQLANERFAEAIRDDLDFMGVNYYFHKELGLNGVKNPDYEDRNTPPYPDELSEVLKTTWDKYKTPIIITETGTATGHKRPWYVRKSIESTLEAVESGVPVHGYLYWTLLDCFEWHSGWDLNFGLVEVDRSTQERTIRQAGHVFAEESEKYQSKLTKSVRNLNR